MMRGWQQRLDDLVMRRLRQREVSPVRLRPHHQRRLSLPPATTAFLSLVGGFALLIGAGTVLLLTPFASVPDGAAPLRVALFTATSAACVTGLVVVDSATYWTAFGQAVIATLMFLGGLGIMTAGTLLLIIIGRRLTLTEMLVLREPMGATTLGSVARLGRHVFLFAVAIQTAGFVFLFLRFLGLFSPGQAAWQALFHSISAFNNAGFVILPDSASLSAFQRDHLVLAIFSVLIVLGGLSYLVIADLARRRRFNRWSLDTRLVVLGSLLLWLVGGAAMFLFEFRNTATLGALPLLDQVGNALFQSVASRTAGFSTMDFGLTRSATDFTYMFLMFIGGASASTAGGIKVNTAMVLLIAAWASLQGRNHPEVFKRELPYRLVARAMAVLVLALMALFLIIITLAVAEERQLSAGAFQFQDLMFEAFSALGTTGLSTGITSALSTAGQLIITAAMYVGRVGPLAIALGLAFHERRAVYRYTQESIRIG